MTADARTPMNLEERDVFARLHAWVREFDALMSMYGAAGRVPAGDVEHARERYRHLKRRLEAEYRRGDTQKGDAAQTAAERRWYQHTVHEAFTRLAAPVHTSPERWFSGLSDARGDFTDTLSRMRGVYAIDDAELP